MKTFALTTLALFLLGAFLFAQQDQTQQPAPPIGDQSSYPSETHKMSPAEKRDTPEGNGQSVDLNTASKKDLAALPGVGPHFAQSIIDARPFTSKEDLLRKKIVPQSTYDQIKGMVNAEGPKKQSEKPEQK
ncbi:MAG: helix-hairpin-helix domain-containing protein [Candidatus Sulfotelmatobacter sp.]